VRGRVAGFFHAAFVGVDFLQRAGEPLGVAGEKRPRGVGQKLALARDGQVYEGGGDGGQDRKYQPNHGGDELHLSPALAVTPAPAAEKREAQENVRHDGNEADEDHHHGREQDVPIAHMRELVRDYPLQLATLQEGEESGRDGDDGVLGIAASGKCVGNLVVYDIELRHGEPGGDGEIFGHGVEIEKLLARGGLCPRHLEDKLVREPVAPDVHEKSEDDGNIEHLGRPICDRERPTNGDDNRKKDDHQEPCLAAICINVSIEGSHEIEL